MSERDLILVSVGICVDGSKSNQSFPHEVNNPMSQIYRVHGFRPFYHGMIFMFQNPGILENHICLFYVENAIGNEKGEKWR